VERVRFVPLHAGGGFVSACLDLVEQRLECVMNLDDMAVVSNCQGSTACLKSMKQCRKVSYQMDKGDS
jgi:hypothetical protein